MKIFSIGIAFACAAVPAAAQDASRSERVSYTDLDIQTAAGQAALENRIRGAAIRVCAEDGVPDNHLRLADDACVTNAFADALLQMNRQIASRARRLALEAR